MSPRQRVVVAGGIASGKSSVIGALSDLGWSVINADEVGYEVLEDRRVVEAVQARWPTAVIGDEVSRSALARIVFADPAQLSALEGITHPAIVRRINGWIESSPEPIAVEVSVLKVVRPEWGAKVIVHVPVTLRKERALERGMTASDVEARMTLQPSDSEMLAAADLVIDNSGTVEQLGETVRRFDQWVRSA